MLHSKAFRLLSPAWVHDIALDKERAETRRRHEDNVILSYLRAKQADHERKLADATLDSDIELATKRVQFYQNGHAEYLRRLEAQPKDDDIKDMGDTLC